jgi:hypothetical protein
MDENLRLFIDHCDNGGFILSLNENATTERGLMKFRGKFQEAEQVNKNKRMYPYDVLDENVKKLTEAIKSRGLVGELDHPTDSIIHFEKASHVITKLWWENNSLMGEGEVLPTPHGKILKSLLDSGVRVGISSRGVGNGKVDENGILVIGESYKLITFDAVADPSTFAAFQEKVVSTTRESRREDKYRSVDADWMSQNNDKLSAKNESTRIHTLNKEVLIACLGGIVKQQTSSIKERLAHG